MRVYESYLGRPLELVVANEGRVDVPLAPEQTWVEFTEEEHPYRLEKRDVVSTEEQSAQAADVVPRAIVIHDKDELEQVFRGILAPI